MFRCGLVVGKFSPLHRGHQYLIDAALSQCEHLILLSYSNPELPGCGADRREQWLRDLYPQTTRLIVNDDWLAEHFGDALVMPHNDAPDDVHREFVSRLLRDGLKREIDAVFTSEQYGEGFAAYLQKRAPVSQTITHVLVDANRAARPISGTAIRQDVHAQREWLDPSVYAFFVERVAILGGESSGKTTLATALATALQTPYCPEYGRELWVERAGRLEYDDMLAIAQTQIEREQRLARRANRYLFCDTTPLTTLFYCHDLFGTSPPELRELADRFYAHVILCAPDFAFVQDGTRRDMAFRARQHSWYRSEYAKRDIPYLEAAGALKERVEAVQQYLKRG
jgi:NadR type nicotinamide-nucleotide adenylyltransferase